MRRIFWPGWLIFTLMLCAGCEQKVEVVLEYTPDTTIAKAKLPDFSQYEQVAEKKRDFFNFMLPLINESNREVSLERQALKLLKDRTDLEKPAEKLLQRLADKYRVDMEPRDTLIRRLLKRVAPIPPSLALAQSANESAWGTSRFAVEGNNLFGQWCFKKGCGLVPDQRSDGAAHEVAKFKSPYLSVRAYMLNINRHDAYRELRGMRAQELANLGYSTGMNLAGGLHSYSERGAEYVEELRAMISYNELQQYDQVSNQP
ncbi:MAG: glucosaminidase domain-containing protein [Thalassolituus sp.]